MHLHTSKIFATLSRPLPTRRLAPAQTLSRAELRRIVAEMVG